MAKEKKVEPTKAQLGPRSRSKLGFKKFELNSLERANKATIVALLVKIKRTRESGFFMAFRDSKYLLRERLGTSKRARPFIFALHFSYFSLPLWRERRLLNWHDNCSAPFNAPRQSAASPPEIFGRAANPFK